MLIDISVPSVTAVQKRILFSFQPSNQFSKKHYIIIIVKTEGIRDQRDHASDRDKHN